MRDGQQRLQGSSTSSESLRFSRERGAELLDAFMECPEPLALLNNDGRVDLANSSFLEQFGPSSVNEGWSEQLSEHGEGGWTPVRLPSTESGEEVQARALRLRQCTLLVVDRAHTSDVEREVDLLRRRLAEVARLATTDYLTGAWNRAHFHHVMELELARTARRGQPVTLILFDVDHFKSINDRFGNSWGDRVLRELALLVRHNLRASDALFRWGGEEFMVLVASAGFRRAQRVAENLRRAVATYPFEGVGTVTISVGVAEHDGKEDMDRWFERLDAALYAAKNSGRNRVVVDRRGDSEAWMHNGHLQRLIWEQEYDCGHAQMDDEHRELFRLANKLIDASLRASANTVVLSAALTQLLEHLETHFKEEEEMLARLRYPELEEHRRAHQGLLRRARKMKEMLLTGRVTVGAIVEFLAEDVVARHLLGVDRAFFPLFQTHRESHAERDS
ncbi:MAG: bacteriohemerythrin [Steroidobacteraceae bacterium]